MTISAASNTTSIQGHVPHQRTGTDTEQTEKSRSNASSDYNLSGNKFDDSVTLSQTDKAQGSAKVVDAQAAERLLSQTKDSILAQSKAAISAQANTTPEAAQDILTG